METSEGLGAPEPVSGWVADEVREEFPELRLISVTLDARPGRSTPGVQERLRGLSDRFRGANAVTMRQDPIPWAYRVFYRHVGLDPDAERTPIEAAAVERLRGLSDRFRGAHAVTMRQDPIP